MTDKSYVKPKSTILDIAKLAGVSKMTVSRVLNQDPKVSDKTRKKVQDIVDKLNFRPNVTARRLSTNKSYFIGLLCESPSGSYVSQFLVSALSSCRKRGYHLVVDECKGTLEEKAVTAHNLVDETNVDGVIVLPPLSNDLDILKQLTHLNIPFVRVSPDAELELSPYVCMDDYEAAFQITNLLISKGHTDIGFIIGLHSVGASRLRYQGFLDAMRSKQLDVPPHFIEQGAFTYKSGLVAAENLLKQSPPPSAIFASNDDMAAAVISVANSKGLNVPEKLSVVGYDDTLLATTIWPQITTVRQPIKEMAECSIDILTSGKMNQKKPIKMSELRNVIDFSIIERSSTA